MTHRYNQEINALLDTYEKAQLGETEIMPLLTEEVQFRQGNKDYLFDMNDILLQRGYSFSFTRPVIERESFSTEKYHSLCHNVSKSEARTEALIHYLIAISDHRLVLASIHRIKIRYLLSLGYLKNKDYYAAHLNASLRDLLFLSKEENPAVYDELVDLLSRIGFLYVDLTYSSFRLDMEYLLWTIERNNRETGYKEVNTIKIAFGIAPISYFMCGKKCFYDTRFSKKINRYLKDIDQTKKEEITAYWKGYHTTSDGYQALLYIL